MRRNRVLKCVLIPIVILWFHHAHSQSTVHGTVKDAEGKGIPFATIQILNSNHGAIADLNGSFKLKLDRGTFKVSVQAVGYAKRIEKVNVPSDDSVVITLEERTETLDEVVVTANKREEDLVQVATAISSLSAKKIEDTRTWNLGGLTALIPNYTYQELGVGFQQVQSIRGIQVFSENPAVATYIDGVSNLDILANGFMFTDIERIEVLRGPQGTLFGRNAMGGVINIITKKPTNETEGFVELSVGNLELQRYAAGIKAPLIEDQLFFGANWLFQSRNGYWENDTTGTGAVDGSIVGETVGGENNLYSNVYFKWLPSSNVEATWNLKTQRDWSDNTGFFVSHRNDSIGFARPDKINLARIGEHERNILNTSLALKYYSNSFTITSVSAYQRISLSFQDIDFPGFFHSFFESQIGEDLPPQEVFSQELRINASSDSKLIYTAGVYGFSQVGYEPSTNLAFELVPGNYSIFRNRGDNYGLAAFGEMTYSLTDKLKVTGGLRYDYEEREATFNGFGDASFIDGVFTQLNQDTTVNGTYSAFSPKLAVSYQLADQSNAYLSYTRGFRAGGVNAQRYPPGLNVNQTFDPEFSDNFEIGYKTLTVNNRLSVNASLFYIDWRNLQFTSEAAPFVAFRDNSGDARSMGIELEASLIPLNRLQLDVTVGVNDTKYTSSQLVRQEPSQADIVGNGLSNAPSHTVFFGAQYEHPFSERLKVVMRGELRNVGSYFTDLQNEIKQPSYTMINSRVGLIYDDFSFFFWGQNLNDEVYLAFGNPDTDFGRSVRTAAPRTYGITLTGRF